MLSNSLILLAFIPIRFPDGTNFFRLKYSVSTKSKLFGWVRIRLVTSSVVTGMYSMVIPKSSLAFSPILVSWFTAVPR